jgi:plastocyanin
MATMKSRIASIKTTTVAIAAAALGCVSGAMLALAAEPTIGQKGRIFSQTEVTIKSGDKVNFLNDDDIVHNVMSTSAGNEFNLGAQAPGISTPVTFKTKGEINVFCAIHPRMKMKVKVTD